MNFIITYKRNYFLIYSVQYNWLNNNYLQVKTSGITATFCYIFSRYGESKIKIIKIIKIKIEII